MTSRFREILDLVCKRCFGKYGSIAGLDEYSVLNFNNTGLNFKLH